MRIVKHVIEKITVKYSLYLKILTKFKQYTNDYFVLKKKDNFIIIIMTIYFIEIYNNSDNLEIA